MKKAVVIIPTYNEKENIAKVIPLLQSTFKNCKDWQMHILVVDDTSPDKTYQVVQELQSKYKNLHLVINKQKAGLGGAYLKGMAEAFGPLKADVVFEFDADLSHDATKIPQFLAAIDAGADMVLGSRYITGGGIPEDWGLHRKFLSIFGNVIIQVILTNFSIRDWTGGYRAITKPVYHSVKNDLSSERFMGYTFQIGFLHKAIKAGFKIVEVPFKFVDRTVGESKLGMEYIKNTLLYILKVRLQDLLAWRFFKFAVVGGIGATIQLSSLILYRSMIPDLANFWSIPFLGLPITGFLISQFLSIETAIVSNFILNNSWTFADRKLTLAEVPLKFLAFNLASSGSILIQLLVAAIGKWSIGLITLFTIPLIGLSIDTGMVYAIVGILLGLSWNFFAYNFFIWKK